MKLLPDHCLYYVHHGSVVPNFLTREALMRPRLPARLPLTAAGAHESLSRLK